MTDLLQGLNPAQREAVTATEGFIRVVAGAGLRKTRALTPPLRLPGERAGHPAGEYSVRHLHQ